MPLEEGDADNEPDLILRPYQMRLVDLADEGNSIIWLGTGMGKTYVAVELIKKHLDVVKMPLSESGKRVIFLTPTVPLARQQERVVARFTNLKSKRCCGVDGVDSWEEGKWRKVIEESGVLVMTPQVLRDCLQKCFISLGQICLLILDECHHSVGDSQYTQIMKSYELCPKESRPRLLAMTATLVNSKVTLAEYDKDFRAKMTVKIQKHIDNLCTTLQCTIRTTEDPKEYNTLGANPVIETRIFSCYDFAEIVERIHGEVEKLEVLRSCDERSNVFKDFVRILRSCEIAIVDLGPLGVRDILRNYALRQKFRLSTSANVSDVDQLRACLDICYKLEAYIAKEQEKTNCEVSSKVDLLLEVLWEFGNRFSNKMMDSSEEPSETSTNSNDDEDDYMEYWLQVMREDGLLGFLDEFSTSTPLPNDSLLYDDDLDFDEIESKRRRLEVLRTETCAKIAAKVAILNSSSSSTFATSTPLPSENPFTLDPVKMEALELSGPASNHSGLCCVVFVEQRVICAALCDIIDRASKDPESPLYNLVNVDFVVGQSSNSGNQYRTKQEALLELSSETNQMAEKRQDAVLAKFRIGLLNVVVATNVLEEGLDVPQCNLIVMFDMPKTPKDFIQSKGRGRAQGAHYVLLLPEERAKDLSLTLTYFKLTEQIMMTQYFGFVGNVNMNARISSKRRDELVPPFCPLGIDGPRIDRLRAVDLINQYAVKLSQSCLDVRWEERQVPDPLDEANIIYLFKAAIFLPRISGIDHPVSHVEWMPGKKLANQAAALEACKLLYAKGELLLDGVPSREEVVQSLADKESIMSDRTSNAGTKKRVQLVERPRPRFLGDTTLKKTSSQRLFFYNVKLQFENVVTEDTRRLLDMIEQSGSSFGLLSPTELASIPKFRLYPRKHETLCSLVSLGSLDISEAQYCELTFFHKFLFDKVIFRNVADLNMELADDGGFLPFVVVPVKNSDLDWNSVRLVADENFSELLLPSSGNLFTDQTVIPADDLVRVTSANSKSLIALTEVSPTMTAQSMKLPDNVSYCRFLANRGIKIDDEKQPLVYGVPLTSHLSHFSRLQLTGKSAIRNVGAFYVPETLRRLPISGSLGALSRYVPSILYRIYQIWIVKEFRCTLSSVLELPIKDEDRCVVIGDQGMVHDFFAPKDEKKATVDQLQDVVSRIAAHKTDPFSELKGQLVSLTADHLLASILDHLKCPSLEFKCPPCQYHVNVHLPGLFRTYFVTKSADLSFGGRFSFKCRFCGFSVVDGSATCFDLLKHIVQTHFRLLSSPYVVWPSFTNCCCQVCLVVYRLTKDFGIDVASLQAGPGSLMNRDACLACGRGRICSRITDSFKPPTEICHRSASDIASPQLASFFQAVLSIRARDIFDNERFEVLGDTFLKYAVTTYLFVKYPNISEGQITFLKGQLVSNRNLRNWASKWPHFNLMACAFVTPFDPATVWLPPLYRDNSSSQARAGQTVRDKVVADTMEALLGLFLTKCGPSTALNFLHSLGIEFTEMPEMQAVEDNNASSSDFSGWKDRLKLDANENGFNADWVHRRLDDVEEKLGYHFKYRHLLLEALCHPSGAGRYDSYERLEVLGDALIDYLVTAALFTKSADFRPGILTTIRMSVVNNDVLGSLCVLHGFNAYISAAPSVMSAIGAFVNDYFVDSSGGNRQIGCCPYRNCGSWADAIEVPKVLGDVFEALAGAVFVDCGLDLQIFWAVFYPLVSEVIEKFVETKPLNPVREVYERFAQLGIKFRYGPPPSDFHLPPLANGSAGVVLSIYVDDNKAPAATGRGLNKRLARQAAASLVLANLNDILPQLSWKM